MENAKLKPEERIELLEELIDADYSTIRNLKVTIKTLEARIYDLEAASYHCPAIPCRCERCQDARAGISRQIVAHEATGVKQGSPKP